MDAFVRHYCKLNIYLLVSIGLWPYVSKEIRYIQYILVSAFLWIGVISQLGTFVYFERADAIFIRNLLYILACLGYFFKYFNFMFLTGTIQRLTEQMKYDWDSLTVEEELDILKKHARMGKYYTRIFTLFLSMPVFPFILSPFASDFLNVVAPLNESRPRQFLVSTDLIPDAEKNFYYIVSIVGIITLSGMAIVTGTESLLFVWLQHCAAMFEIVSYRLKEMVASSSIKKESCSSKREARAFANIVDTHIRALGFFNYFKRKLSPSYFVMIGIGVISMSIHLYRLAQLFDSVIEVAELFASASILISLFAYVYALNYLIEGTIIFSNNVLKELYNTKWYEAPVVTQKMLLLIMLGNVKPISIDLYGFYDSSVQGFAMLLKLSISYFTLLRSVR